MEILIGLAVAAVAAFVVILLASYLVNKGGISPEKLPSKLASSLGSRIKSRHATGFLFEKEGRPVDFEVMRETKSHAQETAIEWSMRLQTSLENSHSGKTMICKGIFANLLGNVLDQSNNVKLTTESGISYLVYGEQIKWVEKIEMTGKLAGSLEALFFSFRTIHIKNNEIFAIGAVTQRFASSQLEECAGALVAVAEVIDKHTKNGA